MSYKHIYAAFWALQLGDCGLSKTSNLFLVCLYATSHMLSNKVWPNLDPEIGFRRILP